MKCEVCEVDLLEGRDLAKDICNRCLFGGKVFDNNIIILLNLVKYLIKKKRVIDNV